MQSVLVSKEGRVVTVRRNGNRVQLCVREHQNGNHNVPSVEIFKREINNKIQMALQFQFANKFYSPKVDGSKLKLERITCPSNSGCMSDCHWFEKENLGGDDHYGLKSVADPRKYLACVKKKKKKNTLFCLSETQWVLLTDRNI